MLKKNGTHYYSALCLSILVGLLAGAMPALGQEDVASQIAKMFPHRVQEGFRLGVLGGTCFHADASSQSCPIFQVDLRWIPGGERTDNANDPIGASQFLRFNPGYKAGLLRRPGIAGPAESLAGIQGTGILAADNTWPEPPDPDPDDPSNSPSFISKTGTNAAADVTQRKGDHKGTITGLAELVLVMAVQPKFSLTPFFGVGVTHIRQGEADSLNHQFAIESKSMFSASYGATIDVQLNPRWDLRFQFRGLVHFPKTLTYIDAENESFTVDIATVATSSLMVGVGYRFPR